MTNPRQLSTSAAASDGWISLESTERPAEGERVWIAGYGNKGRFYADAIYRRGEWLMFDQEADRHCQPCEFPSYWARIDEIPPKAESTN